jgi:catechol 2,3-dioxygenase-like lactoylglutathione lyase family enzyme
MIPDHITLLVQSFDASMPYYDALLPMIGFSKLRDHVWANDGGFHIQFRRARADTRPYERYGAGMNHIGFAAPSFDAVVAIRDAMERQGFPVPEIQDLDGVRALFMKDPDGIRFEISYCPPGHSPVD